MATIKDRKVYGLVNFRGLDKENKPLKVSPFRASDGKNFIIDSDTLKTRPSIKYKETPLMANYDDEIIDFYKFREVFVMVTEKGFKFKYNDKILTINTTPSVKSPFSLDFNFEGLTPYFQEEQNSLFVFCLNNIFVISNFYNEENGGLEHVVIYSLNDKPANPFSLSNSYYQKFEDLPTPYEPTLFIGDNRLDDINLLSNVSKYKLFAKSSPNSQEGMNTYVLPTHYDKEKHGDTPEFTVDFYKNKFFNAKIFPIFLGKENENFTNLVSYGDVVNQTNPIILQGDFVAKETFEYKGDRDSNPTPIKEILGLNKEVFFDLKVSGNTQSVFEYILNYIEVNFPNNEILGNKVLKFTLPYERTSNYRNATTNDIEKVYKEQREESIYVQLKKFNVNSITTTHRILRKSTTVDEFNLSNTFPAYPVTSAVDFTEDITTQPIEKPNYSSRDFLSLANTWIEQNKYREEFVSGSKIKLLGRLFHKKQSSINESLTLERYDDWLLSIRKSVIFNEPSTFPPYPSFDSGTNPVIEATSYFSTSGQNVSVGIFEDLVINDIRSKMNQLPFDKNVGFYKFRWQTYWGDSYGTFYDEGQSVVVQFSYVRPNVINYETRTSYAMTFTYLKEQTNIVDGLYNIDFDSSMGAFVFKCKDYFYDYNNEPSIDIKVRFQNNPDYKIISNSRFGITFGSENRLFLAGNKDYPHIDRFNVSNDLLGNNIKNQSYELSYFPSKNYRVLGGKGAINGYVLATDTQLYITKEDYPNDQKLFIRNRTMDDNGLVGYNEFKTNIDKSPLNNRCLARFYNDILVLDKKGLYGIEISSNVLTNERLVKMRSGFINKELTKRIEEYDKDKVFIYEDNAYMYIFIGNRVFVADSRYISHNENSEIENYSYEIVEWEIPFEIKSVKKVDGELFMLDSIGQNIYTIGGENTDDVIVRNKNYISLTKVRNTQLTSAFSGPNIYSNYIENTNGVSFSFDNPNDKMFKYLAINGDYVFESFATYTSFKIKNSSKFRNLKSGDTIYLKNNDNDVIPFQIYDFDEYERLNFKIDIPINQYNLNAFYIDVSNKPLYPKVVYTQNGINKVILSPYEQEEIIFASKNEFETDDEYLRRVALIDEDYCSYFFSNDMNNTLLKDVKINTKKSIRVKWISAVLDFGNNMMEKTMFKANLYATKQDKENKVRIGYRTMRRFNRFDETGESEMMKGVEISNALNFEEVNFNLFSINTLNEFGASIPMKENNFLYIQFMVVGEGNIEINAIEVLYKLNRMLKTIS